MKVLVTGATGFIGSHLVKDLCSKGESVRVFARKQSSLNRLQGLDVEYFFGDLTDPESARQSVEGVDIVYNIAGLINSPVGSHESIYWESNLITVKNLLAACVKRKIKSFVFCSSVSVMGFLDKMPADESTPCHPQNIYEKAKYEAEIICLKYFQEKGIPVSIIRPAKVYGPSDVKNFKLFKAIAKHRFLMIGNGKTMLHPVYVKDLVCAFQLCAHSDKSAGRTYLIGGVRPVMLDEFVNKSAEILNVRIPSIHCPAFLGRCAAYFLERICPPLKIEPPLFKRRLEFFTRDQAFDLSRAKQELGYTPQVDIEEGLTETLSWYKQEKWL